MIAETNNKLIGVATRRCAVGCRVYSRCTNVSIEEWLPARFEPRLQWLPRISRGGRSTRLESIKVLAKRCEMVDISTGTRSNDP